MRFNYLVFETKNNNYIYDGNSTNLFAITDEMKVNHKEIINALIANDDTQLDLSEFREAVDAGYFKPLKNNQLHYWFDEAEYESELDTRNVKHVMVEMSQDCNMRCRYCVYGGHYPNERVHTKGEVEERTLLNAADILLEYNTNEDKILNFYGGEPFLEFEKIRKTVEYVSVKDPSIKFFFTTNGTLLNNRIAQWFVDQPQVYLFVSLGGVPDDHDELRIMKNGRGSFDLIRNNLLHIKSLDPMAYKARVNFIFNIFSSNQLFGLESFLLENDMFDYPNIIPEISRIDTLEDDGEISLIEDMYLDTNKADGNPLAEYVKRLHSGDRNNVFTKYFDEIFLTVHKRANINDDSRISGVCRPFLNKTFVDIGGDIHICENLRFSADYGNVNNDIKLNNIHAVLSSYKESRSEHCTNCWANKLCTLCFKDFDRKFATDKIPNNIKRCELERKKLTASFIEYCQILEEDESILDHLDNFVVIE